MQLEPRAETGQVLLSGAPSDTPWKGSDGLGPALLVGGGGDGGVGQSGAEVSLGLAQMWVPRCWRASDSPRRWGGCVECRSPALHLSVLVLGSGEGPGDQHVNKPLPHSGGGRPHFGGPEVSSQA